MQQVIGHKLPEHGMVLVAVPVRLHVLFAVPVRLAFQVTANQADRALHNGHGVAIGIAGNGLKRASQEGGAVVEVHVFLLPHPVHGRHRAIRRPDVCLGTLDVLHAAGGFEQVEIVGVSPVRAHANTKVLAAALHEGADIGEVGLQDASERGGLAIATWKHHQVHIIEKTLGHLVFGENFDAGHGRESRNDTIDRVCRAGGVVQKKRDGFLHANGQRRTALSMGDVQHHIADGLPCFHRLMSHHHLVQWISRANGVLQSPKRQHVCQLGQTGLSVGWQEVVDQEKLQTQGVEQQRAKAHADVGRRVGAVANQLPVRLQHALRQPGCRGGEVHVDDGIHAQTLAEFFDLRHHILGFVKKTVRRARGLGMRCFGRVAHGANDLGTRLAQHLGDVVPHRR